jgi:hypothetical protein
MKDLKKFDLERQTEQEIKDRKARALKDIVGQTITKVYLTGECYVIETKSGKSFVIGAYSDYFDSEPIQELDYYDYSYY